MGSDVQSDMFAERVNMVVELLMDAEVDLPCGADLAVHLAGAHRESGEPPQRAPPTASGHQRRNAQLRDSRGPQGLPGPPCSSNAVGRTGPGQRGLQDLRRGISTRRVEDLVRSIGSSGCRSRALGANQEPRRPGGRVPRPTPRRRALHLRLTRCPYPQHERG